MFLTVEALSGSVSIRRPDTNRPAAETTLLFLQLIMRKLRRLGPQAARGGRAAVVVPNGMLFGDGVAARIKEDLLKGFNLHTIVRLPNGVFARCMTISIHSGRYPE